MTAHLGAPRTGSAGVSPTGEAPLEGTLPLEWGAPQHGDARRAGEPRQDAEDLERPDELPGDDGAERPPPTPARRAWGAVFEWLVVGVCALALALLLKAFLVEVFVIPSGSMEPTLMIDNRVVVYKLGYRMHDVNRGDVVVFHQPGQAADADDLIKRVVGLGGETVEIRGGHVYVDGTQLEEPYLARAESTYPAVPIPGCVNPAEPDRCVVPEGKILVLGDNRPESRDGRYFGPVDVDTVVGRAFLKLWPPNDVGGL